MAGYTYQEFSSRRKRKAVKNMFYETGESEYIEIYVCRAIYNKEKRKAWYLKKGALAKDSHNGDFFLHLHSSSKDPSH